MSVMVKETGGDYEHPPVGMQNAICCRVFDLGQQPGFQGKVQHKVLIMWELEERKQKGEWAGKRFLVSRRYTASLNEKATLRKDLESWRSKGFTADELDGFDLEVVVGKGCTLNLVENENNGRTYINVAAVLPKMKAADDLEVETPEDYTPDWVLELMEAGATLPANDVNDDDIPF